MVEAVKILNEKLNESYLILDSNKQNNNIHQAIDLLKQVALYNGIYDKQIKCLVQTAQFTLGELYWNGYDNKIAPNDEQAIYWYSLAGENGHPFAQFWLGNAYCTGQRVSQDHEKAIYWYRKAANMNIAWAQYHLGVYLSLEDYGDLKEAFFWMKKAAEQKVINAQVYVIGAYFHGNGVKKNVKKAKLLTNQLLKMRAEELKTDPNIALFIGKELLLGTTLQMDIEKGISLLSQQLLYNSVDANIQICEFCKSRIEYDCYMQQATERLKHLSNSNGKARSYLCLLKLYQ